MKSPTNLQIFMLERLDEHEMVCGHPSAAGECRHSDLRDCAGSADRWPLARSHWPGPLPLVKPLLVLTMLTFVFSGCRRGADAQVQKELSGKWVATGAYRNGGTFTSNVLVDRAGNYHCRITAHLQSGTDRSFDLLGNFKVQGGVLIDTATNHSSTNAVLPMISRARIVRFDGREMALKWEKNEDVNFPSNEVVFRKVAE